MKQSLSSSAQLLAMEARRLKQREGGWLPRLVFMTDGARVPAPVEAVQNLPRGTLIVFRHYAADDRAERGYAVMQAAKARGHPVLIAGDWRLAVRLRADGVHLPEHISGMARTLKTRRPDWLVTAAAHSAPAVRKAERAGADAAFLSPVFPTHSHQGAKVLGALRTQQIAQGTAMPVYALGGVDEKTARLLQGTRLYGFAAIGAFI